MDTWTPIAADAVPLAALHAAFVDAFADYVAGPFAVAPADFPALLARQGVVLPLSRVVRDADGAVAAFALVAPRARHGRWRLATMGARPAARGRGAAPALLDELIARQPALELEVIVQNPRAQRLYEGRGFEVRHRLGGWERAAGDGNGPVPAVQAVAPAEAWAWLDAAEARLDPLPLQVTAPSLAALPQPPQAWRHGTAQLVFAPAGEATVVLHSLVDLDPAQRDAEALVQALAAAHPGRTLRCPPLQRDDVGGEALRRQGFAPLPIAQHWMLRRPS